MQYFGSTEDMLAALEYAEQVQDASWAAWDAIRQMTGETTSYIGGLKNVNATFDNMIETLESLGVASEHLQEIEAKRQDAIDEYIAQAESQRSNILDDWLIRSGVLSEYEVAVMRLTKEFEAARQALIDLGASAEELAKLDEYFASALDKIVEDIDDMYDKISQKPVDFMEEMERVFESIEKSWSKVKNAWEDFFEKMMTDLAPVQSAQYYGSRFTELLTGATTEQGMIDFLSFASGEYLPFMQSYGSGDYNDVWQQVGDLARGLDLYGLPLSGDYDEQFLDPYVIGNAIGEHTAYAVEMALDRNVIIVKIGEDNIAEIVVGELARDNPEMVTEIRRVTNGFDTRKG
jgi:predicted  nucleic acid-binding Zn-ribbon protein